MYSPFCSLTNCLETSMLICIVYHLISFNINSKHLESMKFNGNIGKKMVDLKEGEAEGKDGKGIKESGLN